MASLRESAKLAVDNPKIGRMVPELEHEDFREIIKGNYRIVYYVTSDAIVVLSVTEGHRLLPPAATEQVER